MNVFLRCAKQLEFVYIRQPVSVAKRALSQDTHHPHKSFRANCRSFELDNQNKRYASLLLLVILVEVVVVVFEILILTT